MSEEEVRVVGRYALHSAIAAGGMATVHLGRLLGPVGFSRTVAIKRLHAQFAADPEFVSMFLDEARLAARIRHPNVVPTLDVVTTGGELFLVMDYVPGESVARLAKILRDRRQTFPLRILSTTIAGVLHGLHAAHEARDEQGRPLGIVHRDVSPQNVLLGTDGVPRVLDFGVAKARGRVQTTKEGQIKGKLAYMPPEQLRGAPVSRQTDIYAVGVMLWELVAGQRLFSGDNEGVIINQVLEGKINAPSQVLMRSRQATLTDGTMRTLEALDKTILRALRMKPEERFGSAREMALELERQCPPATATECADWLEHIARDVLHSRAMVVAEIESATSLDPQNHVLSVLNAKSTLTPNNTPRGSTPSVVDQTGPAVARTLASSGLGQRVRSPLEPPVTQPSSISVASASRPPDAHVQGKRAVMGAIVGVMLGATVLGVGLFYRQVTRPRVTPTPLVAGVGADAGLPISTVTVAARDVPVPTVEADPVAPTPVVKPQAVKPPGTLVSPPPTTKKPSTPTRPTATTTPSAAPTEDCVWYDETGTKRYKPACLGR